MKLWSSPIDLKPFSTGFSTGEKYADSNYSIAPLLLPLSSLTLP